MIGFHKDKYEAVSENLRVVHQNVRGQLSKIFELEILSKCI